MDVVLYQGLERIANDIIDNLDWKRLDGWYKHKQYWRNI
jgi:hypothetical protein